jgi:very-short-patch-repair endonuclease
VWLAETRQRLPDGVAEVLDREQLEAMPVRADLEAAMDIEPVRARALARCRGVLAMLDDELTPETAPWYRRDEWLERAIATSYREFEQAFERWRSLYKATSQQMRRAQEVMNSAVASPQERDEAKRRHDEAFQQQKLLLDVRSIMNSDFYTYRYLASQGFLPGYNFPRLPLLAYVPARREKIARDSFLSRPRFLALAEFGPRSVIYHEGSQYRVVKAILGVRDEDSVSVEARLPVLACRLCPACGYGHFGEGAEAERCAACKAEIQSGLRIESLYRIDNVATRRAMRITSDEEERLRLGYETVTTLQFAKRNGTLEVVRTEVGDDEGALLELQYGPAATVWRINLGWRRRKHKEIRGFNIDVLTGRWAKDAQAPEDADAGGEDDRRMVPQRITPYVEDRRNVLVVLPKDSLDRARMATLQYALKRGIEREFQLEESELVAEALPTGDNRKALLFYEAAEGGAGVLTRLAADPTALHRVAARALEVCHFQPAGETWLAGEPLDQDEGCEAGCYRCLLSYYNQPEHEHIDRRDARVLRLLCRLTRAEAKKGSEGRTFEQQFEELMRLSGSPLEKAFLLMLRGGGYRLPDRAQPLIEAHGTRADFGYPHAQALVYIDGPHHEQERQRQLDDRITDRLEDAGYTVIRLGTVQSTWPAVLARYPDVFGTGETP